MSLIDQLKKVLQDIQFKIPDVEASALISVDGLVITSLIPEEIEEERAAAICAIILNLGEKGAQELARGNLQQVIIKGESGYVVVFKVSEEMLLMLITNDKVKLGMIFLLLKEAIEKINKLTKF